MFGEQFVYGGVFLIIFGVIVAYFRRLPSQIWAVMERHCLCSLHIFDDDESFYWIKLWLAEELKNSRAISVFTKSSAAKDDYMEGEQMKNQYRVLETEELDKRPVPVYTPAPGTYFFWFKNKFCWVYFDRKEAEGQIVLSKPRESFVIRLLSRDRNLINEMIYTARDVALPVDGKIEIRVANYSSWSMMARVTKRPIASVILANNYDSYIIHDIKKFRSNKEWYYAVGIPYRRTYLLYGPPGSGKSSLVLAVASELNMNVNILNLSSSTINDVHLNELLNKCNNNDIVLIEDIDCAFNKRESGKDRKGKEGLTFSGLLNALDGLGSQSGRVIFMTTNHFDKLDEALVRPGRADVHLILDNATKEQSYKLFKKFFPYSELAEKFGDLTPDKKISMASIQGYLMGHKEDHVSAYENYSEFVSSKLGATNG